MKNKLISIVIFVMFLSLIVNPNLITNEIINALNSFINVLFPSIFPFFLLSDLLINYNFQEILNKLFSKLNNFLFHTSNSSNFVIVMSLLSGFPSGSKYIKTLYDRGELSLNQANYLITFTHFSNPLFLLTVAKKIVNVKTSYIILLCHIISNFIIGIITRPKEKEKNRKVNVNISLDFSKALQKSITNSINLLIIILGNTCFFFYISELLSYYFKLNGIDLVMINGLLDLTKGISSISILNCNYIFKCVLILSFVSFGGINVHMQVLSILEDTKISYRNFLFGRMCQTALSITLFLIYIIIFT